MSLRVAVVTVAALSVLSATPAFADVTDMNLGHNDYPYATDTTGGVDPWNFTMRQCTSFVAWRESQGGTPIQNTWATHWGDAANWADEAAQEGIAVGTLPAVGAIAQWDAGESTTSVQPDGTTQTIRAGAPGHVAIVLKVAYSNEVLVEDYNFGGGRSYGQEWVNPPRYIYLGMAPPTQTVPPAPTAVAPSAPTQTVTPTSHRHKHRHHHHHTKKAHRQRPVLGF